MVYLSIADPPSAVAERGLVLGGETCSVELVCQVEGEPCTVLYCTVLYCTVLYCTVLYCTVLCRICNYGRDIYTVSMLFWILMSTYI